METAHLLSTTARRLTNEEVGSLQRRINEIARRVEEGTIDLVQAMAQLQRIIEGKVVPEQIHYSTARPLAFDRPPHRRRRRSRSPINRRLPHYHIRLQDPILKAERVMAEMWEAECIPTSTTNRGRTPINAIMGEFRPTKHDIEVIASTLQWLATPVGREFLVRFLRVSQIRL